MSFALEPSSGPLYRTESACCIRPLKGTVYAPAVAGGAERIDIGVDASLVRHNKRTMLAAQTHFPPSSACAFPFSTVLDTAPSSIPWSQSPSVMSQHSPRSTSFTSRGEPSTSRNAPFYPPERGTFPLVASTPPLEDRHKHARPPPPPAQETASIKEPVSPDSTLSYSDDELSSADGDNDLDAGSDFGEGDSDVPLQQLRESDKNHRDKCFECWEAKKPCVRGSGRGCVRCTMYSARCNASRQGES